MLGGLLKDLKAELQARDLSELGTDKLLELLLKDAGLEPPVRELKFHETRKWRFDFAWPLQKVAVEVEGAIYGRPVYCHNCKARVKRRLKGGRLVDVREGGRHNTGSGAAKDMDKYNAAAALGWRVLRFSEEQLTDGDACIRTVREALGLADVS